MTYREMDAMHQARVDDFLHNNAFFAFSKKQFSEGLQKLKCQETDLFSIGGGGYILKASAAEYERLAQSIEQEREQAIADPETGATFAFEMFSYELQNHEYCYTGDVSETLDALGYTVEEIRNNQTLQDALERACRACQ